MINRRFFLEKSVKTGVAGCFAFLAFVAYATGQVEKNSSVDQVKENRPNIIFFQTDQQRWDALGTLNPFIKTPNLDRLAKEGIIFRQATCQAPSCVPSRNSMMFGLYPSQLGIRHNGSHSVGDAFIPCDPLPASLQKVGYQTAGFGKTHWGRTDQPKDTRGFEYRVVGAKEVGMEKGAVHYQDDDNPQGLAHYRKEANPYGPGEEGIAGYIGATSVVADRDHRDGYVAEKCLEFLDSGMDPNRPLFLYLSFLKPHAGLNVPKQFVDLYDINTIPDTEQPPWDAESNTHLTVRNKTNDLEKRYQGWREAWSKMTKMERRRTTLLYYANCSWLDDYFGRTLAKLEKLGRLENALIVFTSDHGEMLGERNFRFSKYTLYDSSVRVPVILSGSAVPEKSRGTIDDRPAELVDLYPTIVKVAGTTQTLDSPGLDLLGEQKHIGTFCEYHDAGAPAYMWRTKKWKLILYIDKPLSEAKLSPQNAKGELYDLEKDPHEWNNVYYSEENKVIREQLKTELLMHLACTWTSFPVGKG